jgi:hypothetical protein
MPYFCCDEPRRAAIRNHPDLNGIDFLDVVDDPLDPNERRQRILLVHFVNPIAPGTIKKGNVRIEGGERIRNITVVRAEIGALDSPPSSVASPLAMDPRVLVVELSARGDFSRYRLCLIEAPGNGGNDDDTATAAAAPAVLDGIDPMLACVEFSFKVNCPSDFDCKPARVCADAPGTAPEINYLAKDYATFRQLLLDRMAVLAPTWTERSPADLGIALVELAAYAGDHLSYQQDAIVTEGYLGKANRRTSVRRHARLVDYPMHDGRNARVWIQVVAGPFGDGLALNADIGTTDAPPAGTRRDRTKLLTRSDALDGTTVVALGSTAYEKALVERPAVFELLDDLELHIDHNEMRFYTHGARECCLPKGATRAVLQGDLPHLRKGDWLVLMENRGPETGLREDANPLRRHVVRLTEVTPGEDPIGGKFVEPPDDNSRPVTTIAWGRADALPFPLCVSAIVNGTPFSDVSVALGNIALADHGRSVSDLPRPEQFVERINTSLVPDTVPAENPALVRSVPAASCRCNSPTEIHAPVRYRPRLSAVPLTQAAPYDRYARPASAAAATDLSFEDPSELPMPAIALFDETDLTVAWTPVRDLLASGPLDTHFTVEVETDGSAFLRFGNGTDGRTPDREHRFIAEYRLGNGTAGNVGANTIRHLASRDPAIVSNGDQAVARVWNPLPATGGVEPESAEHARQHAPTAFRRLERAVTPADYAALAVRKDVIERCDLDVQRAEATRRWTGSWYTVFLTVDRFGGALVDESFEGKLRNCLERYRMAGQDLEIDAPRLVPLEIEMVVCVRPPYFFADVERALLDAFSNRILPDGRRGVFHPDNFTFGQSVHLSAISAAAQSVPGVDSVTVTKFQRQGIDSDVAIESGTLELGRLEIARLDADPNFPERGALRFKRG